MDYSILVSFKQGGALGKTFTVRVLYDRGYVDSIKYVDETGCYGFNASKTNDDWKIYVPGCRWNEENHNYRSAGDIYKGRRVMTEKEQALILPRVQEEILKPSFWFKSKGQVVIESQRYNSRWDKAGSFRTFLNEIKESIQEERRKAIRREKISSGNKFFFVLAVPLISAVVTVSGKELWLTLKFLICAALVGVYLTWWILWYKDAKD